MKTKKSQARKKSTVPSRVYVYGALPPTASGALLDGGPQQALDLVNRQLRLAKDYYNALVEVEHECRAQIVAATKALPTMLPFTVKIDALSAEMTAVCDQIKNKKKGAGKRADIRVEAIEVDRLRKALKALRTEVKEKRGSLKEEIAAIEKTETDLANSKIKNS